MSSFPIVKLKDCCTVVGGATPKRDIPEYWGNDIPWVTPKDISDMESPILDDAPEYISKKGFKSCSTYLLPKGSILLTSRAPIGNVAIAGKAMCTNQGFKSLTPGNKVDSSYLYHCIKYLSPQIQSLGNGATFKEVSKKVVEEFKIPLPPLEEQKRIAAMLDKADAIRRKRQQAIELADQFLRSAFLNMIGDPTTNPKGWDQGILSEYVAKNDRINYGVVQPGKYFDGGIPLVRAGDIKNMMIDISELKLIDPEIEKNYKRSRLIGDEVLIACVGAIGDIALVPEELAGANIARAVARVRFNNDIDRYFGAYMLSCESIRNYFIKETRTVAQPTLNIKQITETKIIVPPKKEQLKFSKIYKSVLHLKSRLNRSLDEINSLFTSLTLQAFSTELLEDKAA